MKKIVILLLCLGLCIATVSIAVTTFTFDDAADNGSETTDTPDDATPAESSASSSGTVTPPVTTEKEEEDEIYLWEYVITSGLSSSGQIKVASGGELGYSRHGGVTHYFVRFAVDDWSAYYVNYNKVGTTSVFYPYFRDYYISTNATDWTAMDGSKVSSNSYIAAYSFNDPGYIYVSIYKENDSADPKARLRAIYSTMGDSVPGLSITNTAG